ncbi:MAG: hypothetical protein J0L88_06495 [Xanthomonadales bacterium]|nr:hypothetical protein [Xanthomonadales bacterium]
MKETMMRLMVAAAFVACSAGCASVPKDDVEKVIPDGEAVARSVMLCRTQVSELQARLGTPSRDGLIGSARILTWVVAWDPLVRYLGVMADASGTVVDMTWDLPSEVTWSPQDHCAKRRGNEP